MRNKEDYKGRNGWHEISVFALENAMRNKIPSRVYKLMYTKSRETEVKNWRNACMISYWLCGLSMDEASKKMGRSHCNLVNSLNRFDEEYQGFADFGLSRKIADLNNHAYKNRPCEADEIQLGDLIVSYYAYYEESDEEVGFIGGWRVEVLGVRGIVESEHLVGGVIELKIWNYDEEAIIHEIINKL